MPNPNGIRCAHCKGRHDTVAQVKLCAHREAADREAHEEAEMLAEIAAERAQARALETNMEQAEETSAEAWMDDHYWDRQMQAKEAAEDRAKAEWEIRNDRV